MTNIEDELIKRAQAADIEAFCQLTARYQRRIYSLALHYCHNPQDAEDLSQEVWLKAYEAIGGFRSESGFYTWIRRITINCFLNVTVYVERNQRTPHHTPQREGTERNATI